MSYPLSQADLKLNSYVLDNTRHTLRVCAWCFPTDSIFKVFPELAGTVAISHGICFDHKKKFSAEISSKKP